MSGKKERLGKLEKARKFAPKKTSQKTAAAPAAPPAHNAAADAGPSTSAPADDPFSKLIEQARDAQADTRKRLITRKDEKLQVAFGGGKVEPLPGKATRGGDTGPSTSRGATSSAQTYGRASSKAKVLDDDDDEAPLAQPGESNKEKKERLPFLDVNTYYPTLLPFQDATELHDSEALCRPVRPVVLAETEEPPEGNTAATLGINAAAPDGSIWMMQLPPMLPSLTLVEAAEQKAAAATNPADASATPVPKPALPLLSGPEVLHALPNGKVGTLKVMKSGKVRMKIGCCEYVVMPGVGSQSRSEVHVINLRTQDIVMVGANCPHAVAALDLTESIRQQSVGVEAGT